MAILLDEAKRMARLAGLHFSDADLVRMANVLETSGVEPLTHVHENDASLRKDFVSQTISRDDALGRSSVVDGTFFHVPKVIE